MPVTKVEVVVLGLLAEGPLHGYDLLERFRARSMGHWVEVGKASVYQTLQRLERRGLVGGRAQEGTEGPDRRVYRITRAGRDRLRGGIVEGLGGSEPYASGAEAALGFAHLLPASEFRRAADARERAIRDLVEAVKAERARTAAERGPVRTVSNAMLEREEALAKADLAWLRSFRAAVGRLRR